MLSYQLESVGFQGLSHGCVYGTGIASETLFTSAIELPVCPDTQASLSCLYVFAIVLRECQIELDAMALRRRVVCWPLPKRKVRSVLQDFTDRTFQFLFRSCYHINGDQVDTIVLWCSRE